MLISPKSGERLKQLHNAWDNPYGQEGVLFSTALIQLLKEKMTTTAEQRLEILLREIELKTARAIALEEAPSIVTSLIIRETRLYGLEEVVRLLEWAVAELQKKGVVAPEMLLTDLQETTAFLQTKI